MRFTIYLKKIYINEVILLEKRATTEEPPWNGQQKQLQGMQLFTQSKLRTDYDAAPY